mgnify:FL=1
MVKPCPDRESVHDIAARVLVHVTVPALIEDP